MRVDLLHKKNCNHLILLISYFPHLLVCILQAVSMSEAAVSFLLSPLSLYSWMASTLLRFLVSLPALVLGALHESILLLLAGPWCVAAICFSFLLACFHVGLYLLHMALVVGAMAMLTLSWHKKTVDASKHYETAAHLQQKGLDGLQRRSGRRFAQQG